MKSAGQGSKPSRACVQLPSACHRVSGPPPLLLLSVDGVPFLMRDRTLQRTTDVAKVFPDRQGDEASSFNWTDLQQLNAGRWFLKVRR